MKLIKAKVIGTNYFHTFDVSGVKQNIACTQQEYEALALPKAANPTLPNGVWLNSYSDYKYDTATGLLEDGYYADNGATYIAKLPDEKIPRPIEKHKIVNDEVDEKDLPKEETIKDKP